MKRPHIHIIYPAIIVSLLSACSSTNKFAASFGKRKYFKGYYFDCKGTIASREKPEIKLACSTFPKKGSPSTGVYLYNAGKVLSELTPKNWEKHSNLLKYIAAKKGNKFNLLSAQTSQYTYTIGLLSDKKDEKNSEKKLPITFRTIFVYFLILLMFLALAAIVCGIVSFFTVVFAGISPWLLIITGIVVIVLSFYCIAGLILGDMVKMNSVLWPY